MLINSYSGWFWHMVYKIRSTFYKTSVIRYKRMNCVCLVTSETAKSAFWTIVVPEYASIYTPHVAGTVIAPYYVVKGHLPPTTTPEYHDDLSGLQGMNDLTITNNQCVLVFSFSFFLIKHIVSIDFLLSIYTSSHYIYRNMNPFMSIFEIQSIFFRFMFHPYLFMSILFLVNS